MAISRRRVLQVGGGMAGILTLGGIGLEVLNRLDQMVTPLNYSFPDTADVGDALTPTPACDSDNKQTEPQVEGPFYTPNTPLRTVLREPGTAGIPLVIEGRVLSADCRPIKGAVLDIWSCDANGAYDDDGFKLRGHQFTDNHGAFRIETVKPGDYGNFLFRRTPHIHAKVQGRETALLTTQLFFPGEPLNQKDLMFSESLLLKVENSGGRTLHASFNFVLAKAHRPV